MAKIEHLVDDIYSLLERGGEDIPDSAYEELGKRLAESIKHSMKREKRGTLRMSNVGTPCNRKLYYSVNHPELAEGMPGWTYMKFLTGHVLEDILLFLAEQSGHRVEGRQDEQEIEGVLGHRDAVIDGTTVDVKTASTYSFKKFESGQLSKDDPFGYIDQIQSYLYSAQDDPIVTDKDRAAFLVVDKTLGHICLDIHQKQEIDYPAVYRYKKDVVNSDELPARGFSPEPDGASGNEALGMFCSYCDYKKACHPNLRTFLYSGRGPKYLTKVVKQPNVPEIK